MSQPLDERGSQDRIDPVRRFYETRRSEPDPARKVSWRTPWCQEYRFEVLCEILDRVPPAEPVSILDVGCGLGDLAAFLRRRGDAVRYLGVDILPEMADAARARHPDEAFLALDILSQEPPGAPFDYVLASGALSVKTERHEEFVHSMVARMLSLCRRGLAFNMQSARARSVQVTAQLDTDIHYADAIELYRFCRSICPRVCLREDFVSTDFAIFMYPGETRAHRGYRAYLELEPPHPDRHSALAYILLDQQLAAEALAALADAPPSPDALNYRGLSHLHLGQPREALAPLREALALDPLHLAAPVNLGVALSMLRRDDEAIAVWQQAILVDPHNSSARIKLAHALILSGRCSEALVVADAITDPSLADNLRGLALHHSGRLDEARVLLERVAARNPDMAKVRYELGALHADLGDELEAARWYLDAMLLQPEHSLARKALRKIALRHRGQGAGRGAALRSVLATFVDKGLAAALPLLAELDATS